MYLVWYALHFIQSLLSQLQPQSVDWLWVLIICRAMKQTDDVATERLFCNISGRPIDIVAAEALVEAAEKFLDWLSRPKMVCL